VKRYVISKGLLLEAQSLYLLRDCYSCPNLKRNLKAYQNHVSKSFQTKI